MLALSNYRRKLFDLQTFQNQAHIISVTGIIIYFLGTYYLYTIKIGLWKGPDTRSKCVVTMNPAQAGQSGVVGTRSAPPGLTEDIRSPQKGPFGAQTNPFCLFSRAGWFHMGYNSAE